MPASFDEPYQLDLPVIWRGLPWGPVTVTISDTNGDPVNLTGFTVSAATPLFSLNPVITTPAAGLVTLGPLIPATTSTLPIGDQNYDLTGIKGAGGFTKPFFAGKIPVKQPIS